MCPDVSRIKRLVKSYLPRGGRNNAVSDVAHEAEFMEQEVVRNRRVNHRIRLYHRTDSNAARSARTAAAAEKRAVISVSRDSNTSRALRVW
jgi:hypothetical protein